MALSTSSVECVSLELDRPEPRWVGRYICCKKISWVLLLFRDFLNSWEKVTSNMLPSLPPYTRAAGIVHFG